MICMIGKGWLMKGWELSLADPGRRVPLLLLLPI